MAKSIAYTMIKLDVFKKRKDRENLVNYIRGLKHVSEVQEVYGPFDVVAKIEADNLDKIKETVENDISGNDKIHSTETIICLEGSGFERDPKTGKNEDNP